MSVGPATTATPRAWTGVDQMLSLVQRALIFGLALLSLHLYDTGGSLPHPWPAPAPWRCQIGNCLADSGRPSRTKGAKIRAFQGLCRGRVLAVGSRAQRRT